MICAGMDTMSYFQGHSITTGDKRNTHPQIQVQIFITSHSHNSGWEHFIKIGGKQIQEIQKNMKINLVCPSTTS